MPRKSMIAVMAAAFCLAGAAGSAQTLPSGPIPYTVLRPAAPKPKPRPVVAAPKPAAPAPAMSTAAPLDPVLLETFVDGMVREAMAADHIAGVTVSVVQNGQVVMKKGYGAASLSPARPVDPDRTLFRIGSISKTFTWIALMREIEAGRMRLDAPVNLYLPLKVQVRDDGYDTPVTLRHLMTHTPGFEDRVLGQLFERDADRVRPLATYLRQERPRRVREPGEVVAYSNYGAALAGMAVSTVTGKTFEALVEQQIINPLGLTRTTFREPRPARPDLPRPMSPALAKDVSEGFRWTPTGYRARPFEFIGQVAPAGSASSTAGDMARYMNALLAGDGRAFGPRTARWMRASLYRPAPGADGWNHGFQDVAMPGGRRAFGHAGATLSFHSNMLMVPELGLGVFVSTNTETGYRLAQRLPGEVVQHFYSPARKLPLAGAPSLVDNARAYEGAYLTTRRSYGGLERLISAVTGFSKVKVTPEGYISRDGPNGPQLWAPTAQRNVFQALDGPERMVFVMKDGRAAAFVPPGAAQVFERKGRLAGVGLLSILAGLSAIASVATITGVFTRDRRDFRQTTVQSRASLMQTIQSVLWLLAMTGFGIWAAGAADSARAVYNWPGGWMITASACALVASVLTLITLLMLPVVWRGGRRVDSWTPWRKLRFSITALIFMAFAIDLGWWGALTPWSS